MIPRILVTAFSLCLAQTAQSANLNACVGTAAELEAALVAAVSNGSSIDSIKVRIGTYKSATNPFGSSGSFPGGDSITIEGGWSDIMGNPCQTQSTDPSLTVIDGEGVRGGMELSHSVGAGSITVRNLTFQNGHREILVNFTNDRGGGLYIWGPAGDTADVLVERCIFRNNFATFGGGGLYAASGGGTVTVRNNLLVGNTAQEGAAMYVAGNGDFSYISNNTATTNISPSLVTTATLDTSGNNTAILTNNIFWNNTSGGQSDVFGPALLLIGNDIQQIAQTPAPGSSGNISVDPKFASASDFHLTAGSPAINSGVNVPLGGLAPLDLDGQARVQAGTVDLGAYEFGLLFRNGFEQP